MAGDQGVRLALAGDQGVPDCPCPIEVLPRDGAHLPEKPLIIDGDETAEREQLARKPVPAKVGDLDDGGALAAGEDVDALPAEDLVRGGPSTGDACNELAGLAPTTDGDGVAGLPKRGVLHLAHAEGALAARVEVVGIEHDLALVDAQAQGHDPPRPGHGVVRATVAKAQDGSTDVVRVRAGPRAAHDCAGAGLECVGRAWGVRRARGRGIPACRIFPYALVFLDELREEGGLERFAQLGGWGDAQSVERRRGGVGLGGGESELPHAGVARRVDARDLAVLSHVAERDDGAEHVVGTRGHHRLRRDGPERFLGPALADVEQGSQVRRACRRPFAREHAEGRYVLTKACGTWPSAGAACVT